MTSFSKRLCSSLSSRPHPPLVTRHSARHLLRHIPITERERSAREARRRRASTGGRRGAGARTEGAMGRLFSAAQRTSRVGSRGARLRRPRRGSGGSRPRRGRRRGPAPGHGRRERSFLRAAESSRAPAPRPAASLVRHHPYLLGPCDRRARGRGAEDLSGSRGRAWPSRVAAPDSTYGDGPVPEIPIILLKDDPIVERRPSHVMGLVVRHQEPSRVVWAFLENVRWTLREGRDRRAPGRGSRP